VKHATVRALFLILSPLPLFLLAGLMLAGDKLFQGEIAAWNFLWVIAAILMLSAAICAAGIVLAIVSRAQKRPFGAFVVGALLGGAIALHAAGTIVYWRLMLEPHAGEIHDAEALGLQWPVEVREAAVLGHGQSVSLLLVDKAGTERRYILDNEPESLTRYELIIPFESGQFAGLQSLGHGTVDEVCVLPLLEIWMGRKYGKGVQRSMAQGDFRAANRLVARTTLTDTAIPDPKLVIATAQRLKENMPPIGTARTSGLTVCWRYPADADVMAPQAACVLRPGDTLASLSQHYYRLQSRLTMEAILKANPHLEENKLENGMQLVIPALHIEGVPKASPAKPSD
jgi:hypothetical protein